MLGSSSDSSLTQSTKYIREKNRKHDGGYDEHRNNIHFWLMVHVVSANLQE